MPDLNPESPDGDSHLMTAADRFTRHTESLALSGPKEFFLAVGAALSFPDFGIPNLVGKP